MIIGRLGQREGGARAGSKIVKMRSCRQKSRRRRLFSGDARSSGRVGGEFDMHKQELYGWDVFVAKQG
jgi:hypothetical protein